jgi:hypothetical protein
MSKDYLTFYSYVRNNKTELTNLFQSFLDDSIMGKLPDRVCSSKAIYEILHNDLDTYFKQRVFRNTFMEYFKWKVLYSSRY